VVTIIVVLAPISCCSDDVTAAYTFRPDLLLPVTFSNGIVMTRRRDFSLSLSASSENRWQ